MLTELKNHDRTSDFLLVCVSVNPDIQNTDYFRTLHIFSDVAWKNQYAILLKLSQATNCRH